jgi:hypothetical protein
MQLADKDVAAAQFYGTVLVLYTLGVVCYKLFAAARLQHQVTAGTSSADIPTAGSSVAPAVLTLFCWGTGLVFEQNYSLSGGMGSHDC